MAYCFEKGMLEMNESKIILSNAYFSAVIAFYILLVITFINLI
jgi:hypothetical protein